VLITLASKPLAEAVGLLAGMQSRHMATTMPVLGHMLVSHNGAGEVTLAVTDMELRGRVALPDQQLSVVSDGKPESIAVKIPVFLAQAKNASEASEMITLRTTENFRLHLKSKRFSAQMVGIDPGEFPNMDFAPPEPIVSIQAGDLHKLLHTVMPSVDDSQFDVTALTGVNLTVGHMWARSAATDKNRMTVCTVPVESRCEDIVTLFLPKALVQHTLRMVGRLHDEELVRLGRSRLSNSIFVWAEDHVLASREMAVTFPDLTVWLETNGAARRIVVSITELERVLNAALPFAVQELSEIPRVELKYANGVLRVACENRTTGEFEAELEARAEGCESMEVKVNAAFLKDFISSMKSAGDEMAIAPPLDRRSAIQFFPAGDTEGRLRGWCAPML
jgi:DNA polymerase III sliding clamp (beta) subunit (PCNA family)